jgi:archaellum component FlaC
MERTKRLADLFGGMLKSDEELYEKIHELLQQAEADEALAQKLRSEIEELKRERLQAKTEASLRLDEAQTALDTQKNRSRQRLLDLGDENEHLTVLTTKVAGLQRERSVFLDAIAPLAPLVHATVADRTFFAKLSERLANFEPTTKQLLQDLADAVGVPSHSSDIPYVLDTLQFKQKQLVEQIQTKNELDASVVDRLEARKSELHEKKKQCTQLQREIQSLEADVKTKVAQERAKLAQEREVVLDAERQKAESLAAVREQELSRWQEFSASVGVRPRKDESPDDLIHRLCAFMSDRVRVLKAVRETRQKEATDKSGELERRIFDVESATDAISRANRHLMWRIKK